MNAINQKTISISIFKSVLPLFVILFIQVAANAQSYTQQEQNCFNLVQGKVAYDKAGNRTWSESNIRNLCKGTTDPAQTINCFSTKISAGVDWSVASPACAPTALKSTSLNLNGSWTMYNDKNVKIDKSATISQSGANLSINNGYGANSTAVLNGKTLTTSDGLTGTISADGTRINWNIGFVWVRTGSTANNQPNYIESETQLTPEPIKDATNKDSADSGMITRTITIKNNSGTIIAAYLKNRRDYDDPNNKDDIKTNVGAQSNAIGIGGTNTFGGNKSFLLSEELEFWITPDDHYKPIFKVTLPKNKDLTTFCYEVTGTYFVSSVKTCDGSQTYESKYISFKNEGGYNSTMSLTYYPTGGSTTKTARTISTTAGFQTKLYLPMDADTERQMILKTDVDVANRNLLTKDVTLSDFESTCYKVWGNAIYPKVSPCSLNSNARKIKLWNNAGYIASMEVTYYDKDQSGKDVGRTVKTNKLELTQTETIEVPNGTSNTPIKVIVYNSSEGKEISTFKASANFTGELCYKVEGATFAPTAATCDDTVGDTTGETRQIRFQNDAGYDAQMIITYFEDQIINGTTVPMAKTLSTGFINGLSGKFRLVTIPKNTAKGMQITIAIQGSTTVKNEIFSTTLPADFSSSPQPCFKVTGTLFDPSGGKCNQ